MRNKKTKLRATGARSAVIAEAIERRLLMSTYTVNSLSDAITPVMGQLTLRQAMADANAHAGADTIAFDPTVFTPGSLHTITLAHGRLELSDQSGTTTITGPGSGVLAVSGGGMDAVLQIDLGVTASISGMTITDGKLTTNPGVGAWGGGVNNTGTLTLTGVTVSNNSAIGGSYLAANSEIAEGIGGSARGGGIYSSGKLTLVNSVISGNTAQGGSSYAPDNPPATNTGQGGGIYVIGSLTVTGSMITGNVVAGGEGDGGTTGAEADGGGIYATGTVTLGTTTVSNNSTEAGRGEPDDASQNSGGLADGGGMYVTAAANISSGSFTSNSATGGNSGGGGGIGGSASGGAIFSTNSLTLTSVALNQNSATGGNGPFDDSGPGGNGSGGAIAAEGPLTVSSSSVLSNQASGGFGNALFTNKASGFGGGIYSTQSLSITGSTISGNVAQADMQSGIYGAVGGAGQGGGVFAGGATTITSSTIAANIANGGVADVSNNDTGSTGGNGEGGGVYGSASLTIIDTTFTTNAANGGAGSAGSERGGNGGNGGDGSGGAIYSTVELQLYDSTISGNTVSAGAGGVAAVDRGYQVGNAGSGLGGGVTISAGPALLDNSIISANTVDSEETDIFGSVSSASANNLIGSAPGGLVNGVNGNITFDNNPQLSPLGNNGGPTQTMLPMYNSLAVNAGNNSLIPAGVTKDQRGFARISDATVDIGAVELQTTTISGTVFNDTNGDGIRESGEPGLAGVKVYVDLPNTGSFQAGEPNTLSDSNGNFTLTNVLEGTVIVRQVIPTGYRQSVPALNAADQLTLTPAGASGIQFGDSTRLYVSGTVTLNGIGQGGVLVYADLNNDGVFETNENNKTTSSNGTFSFVSLTAGTYTFRVVPPVGTSITGNTSVIRSLGSGGITQNVSFTLVSKNIKQLTGTVIGTSGSYENQGNTAAKAFDGNLSTFFDAPTASGSWAGLDLGSPEVIISINYAPRAGWADRMFGGMFQASNSPTFSSGVVTLATINTSNTPADELTTIVVNSGAAYRYVRYIGPANSFCNIAEAQFFGTAPTTPTKLTGTTIGSAGSYSNQGNTIANVFDGNLNTFFDAPTASGSWVGLDLGSAQVVTQVEYAPRAGWTSRMVGGEIQASNTADFSSGVVTLFTITSTPTAGVLTTQSLSNSTAYRYYRYIGPANSYCNIAELEFDG